VRKAHTQSVCPIRSAPAGPIGWLSEGKVRIGARPVGRRHLALETGAEVPPVALLGFGSGDEGLLTSAVAARGYRGLVIEATGGGHVNARCVGDLERLAGKIPVVLASRTAAGEVLRRTYLFPGSESDLIARGLIPAGAMTGAQARMLLRLLLAANTAPPEVGEAFEALSAPGDPAELLGGRLVVTA
jgi:L-asparaginase